jgi:methionyl-tRNA formyltransferase
MRLLFFGMRCVFSPPVLAALIEAGHELAAIVIPGAPGETAWRWERPPGGRPGLPMAGPPTLDSLAARHAIPLAHASRLRDPGALEQVRALRPDLIVVACFPRLLPGSLIDLAPRGGINLHPSLLPAFRGPEPLFWTLRAGLRASGVTAHQISDRFDTGAIYAKRPLGIPLGERLDAIEHRFALAAGELAIDVVASIEAGAAWLTPQDDSETTAAPVPNEQDFIIPVSWTAERAYAFARAVAPLGGPLRVQGPDGTIVPVADAVSWSEQPLYPPESIATCDTISTPFVTGYVRFKSPKI